MGSHFYYLYHHSTYYHDSKFAGAISDVTSSDILARNRQTESLTSELSKKSNEIFPLNKKMIPDCRTFWALKCFIHD